MAWLDGLFSDYQFDPQTYRNPPGSGWLGPIAGGSVPFGQLPSPQGFPPIPSSNVPVATQPSRSRAVSAPPGPMESDAASAPMAGNVGREAEQQNPLMSLLGGIGDGVSRGIAGLLAPGGQGAALGAPNLLDRLTAGATNLTTGGNPLAGVLNAVNGLATGQRTDHAGLELAQQQVTMRALMNAGVDAVTAHAAAINPDYLKALVTARYGAAPTARLPPTAPRAGTNRIAGTQPGRMTSAGANATTPPGQPGPTVAPSNRQSRPLSRVATPTEAARLPSGTHFLDPRGVERVVP
jgi:hypothetical protein